MEPGKNPEFKGGNPMRVDILGSPNDKVRRPITNSHVVSDVDPDEVNTKPKKVAKPPRADSNRKSKDVPQPGGAPPPPPPLRKKNDVDSEGKEEHETSAVEMSSVPQAQEIPKERATSEKPDKGPKEQKERVHSTAKKGREANLGSPKDVKEGTAAAAPARDSKKDDTKSRFVGTNLVQYGLWAHFLAYGAAMTCLCMGAFAMAWTDASTYGCKVDGEFINSKFLYTDAAETQCPTTFTAANGEVKTICCSVNSSSTLQGYFNIGIVYILYGIFIFLYENTSWGYGLYFPNDTFFYQNRISGIGILHIIVGAAGCYNYATALAGSFLLVTGFVYCYAASRFESGDGGRALAKRNKENAKKNPAIEVTFWQQTKDNAAWLWQFNPVTFIKRIYNEDKLSSYVWVGLFLAGNIVFFIYTLLFWIGLVGTMVDELKDGTLNVYCDTRLCHTNRKVVRFGPFSLYAALAKGCGACLNLNSALILLPVIKMILRKLNNSGVSFSASQHSNDYFSKFFARPLTRYMPLQKNIEFHKLCAGSIFIFSWLHLIFHCLNLLYANNATLRFFRMWESNVTDYFTGALVFFAMFIIYSAAPDIVRYTKFEIFFNTHHFFTLYFLAMFLHGPVFFYWCVVPVLLYLFERYMQMYRGNRPYTIVKVEWIPPVMAIYFRPVFKEDFPFKEGQYLYMNCPYISKSEWHPFTISSAYDDLHNGPRIHLETGEEVVEIPRPKGLPANAKWNKYCLVSKDYTTMDPNDYLDKSETGYNDFISIHVKVHGLEEPTARTWTRKLKEYFELMSPGKKFPFYFHKRDQRGEIVIGRQYGPDGKQIICVDGPHSAPSEHYTSYGTCMLIGAGIGLTPCASILCALTKYRWKKNFNPELLHFYWVVRQNELDSFQWLVHMLTELSFELKKSKAAGQIERKYYCEINIYVTGVDKKAKEVLPLYRPKKTFYGANCQPTFSADELYAKLINPTVDSRGQMKKMREANPENRLQDVWIWNGRPHWDEIFKEMKDQRQHSDIGVCFCGAPVIGADLKSMCEKYSSVEEDCLFTLHKENF